jgi:hypothetical protein
MSRTIGITLAALALVLVACDEPVDDDFIRRNRGLPGSNGSGEGEPGSGDPTQPGSCDEGKPHVGFAGTDFAADRSIGALGADRRRVKPFSALESELRRVLGVVPASLSTSASAFGDVPARWYAEPVAGAVSLYTTYSLAFTACYDSMTDSIYSQAPTTATATAECKKLQHKAWLRAPTAEETKACVDLATTTLASEPSPRRRWAHACASVLSAAGFVSY